jgi:phage tail tape-measure protein
VAVTVTFTADASSVDAALGRLQGAIEQRMSQIERRLDDGQRATQQFTDRAARHIQSLQQSFAGLHGTINGVIALMATVGAGRRLSQLASDAIEVAASFEQLDTQLRFVVGSMEAFQKAKQFILDFTRTTPFQLGEVSKAFIDVTRYGLDAERTLKAVAGAASFQQAPTQAFQGIIYALNQIASAGKLRAQELQVQLSNWGVSVNEVREELRLMGLTLKEDIGTSGITALQGIEAVLRVLEKTAKGALEATAGNWVIMVSNLKDTWNVFQATVVSGPLFDFLKGLVLLLADDMTAAVQDNKAEFAAWGETVKNIFVAALRIVAQFLDFLYLIAQTVAKVGTEFARLNRIVMDFEARVGAAVTGTFRRIGETLGLLSQAQIQGGTLQALQEGKVTLEDVNKALQENQAILQRGVVLGQQVDAETKAYYEAHRKGAPVVEESTQSIQEWWAALIGADPRFFSSRLESTLADAEAKMIESNRKRDAILDQQASAAEARIKRAQEALARGVADEKTGQAAAQATANLAKAQEELIQASLKRQEALIAISFNERRDIAEAAFMEEVRRAPGDADVIAQARLEAMRVIAMEEATMMREVRDDANERLLAADQDVYQKQRAAHAGQVAELAKIEASWLEAQADYNTRAEENYRRWMDTRSRITREATAEETKELVRQQKILEDSIQQGQDDFIQQTKRLAKEAEEAQKDIQREQVRQYRDFVNRLAGILEDIFSQLLEGTLNAVDFFKKLLYSALSSLASAVITGIVAPLLATMASSIMGMFTSAMPASMAAMVTKLSGVSAGVPAGEAAGIGWMDALGLTTVFAGLKSAFSWFENALFGAATTMGEVFGFNVASPELVASLPGGTASLPAGTLSTGQVFQGIAMKLGAIVGLAANIWNAIQAERLGARIGSSIGAAAALATLVFPNPITLALAAIAPLLGSLVDMLSAPKGPRLAIGGLGGLGIGTEGGQLTLTGALTSQVQRAERLEGVDTGAIQSQLAAGVTAIVQGMVSAINAVALDPVALAGPTAQALKDAMANALVINSSNAKKMEADVQAQLQFIPVQIASYFLRPLNEAFRQLETATLDEQLERLPASIQGMIQVFQDMNEQLNQLAGVANTDVLRQLSEVRNRVEDFGNALADTARVISASIVDQTLSQLEADLTAMIDLPLAERIIEFAALFQDSLQALATLRFTADQIGGAGLDATGVEAQWTRLAEAVMTEAGMVAEEIVTAAIADMADILAQMGQVSVRTQASMVASLFEDSVLALQALWSVWHQLASQEVDTTGVVEQFNRLWYDTIANLDTLVKTTFDQGTFSEFLAVVVAIPPELAAMSEEIAALRNTAIAFAQVAGQGQVAMDDFTAAMETPADVIARTAEQMAELDAAIAAAGDDVSLLLPLYAEMQQAIIANANAQIAQLQQIGSIIDQINAIQFGEMTSLEQFASLQDEINRVLAEATVTGTTPEGDMFTAIELTTEQLAEIVDLYAQQLDVLQQLTSAIESSLESIDQTFFAQMTPQEQMADVQAEMNRILADIAATGEATPDQLIELVDLTQQALALQQEMTRLLESTLADLQATLFEAQSPALQIQQVQGEINTLMARALEGTATPEELQRLVDLNQELLTLGEQNDLLDIQQQALDNLTLLEPMLQDMLDASKLAEDALITQLENLEVTLGLWLTALQTTEDAILAELEYQRTLLEAQLLNDYGTTSVDVAILTEQQNAVKELQNVQEDLRDLYDSLGLIADLLSAPAPNELPAGAATNAELQAITRETSAVKVATEKSKELAEGFGLNTRIVYMQASYQQGGYVGLASGGRVPVMLEPGEVGFPPPVPAWAVTMNRAIPRFGGGGFLVPGSGEGDQVAAWLPEGTFILNKRATHAMGFQEGGTIPPPPVPQFITNVDYITHITVTIRDAATNTELRNVTRRLATEATMGLSLRAINEQLIKMAHDPMTIDAIQSPVAVYRAPDEAMPTGMARGGFVISGSGASTMSSMWMPPMGGMTTRTSTADGLQGGGTVRGGLGWGSATFNITIHQQPGQSTRELVSEIRRQLSREWKTGNSGPI